MKSHQLSRYIAFGLLAGALSLTVSCSHKKPKQESGAGENSATISQEPMTFPADGSDSGQIAGLETIHFAFDSSAVSHTNRQILKKDSEWMKNHSNTTVQIEGHCDQRGSVEYNLALGERRAKAVKAYLVRLGVDSGHLTVISYGKEKPIDTGDTEAAYAKNRRANFVPLNN